MCFYQSRKLFGVCSFLFLVCLLRSSCGSCVALLLSLIIICISFNWFLFSVEPNALDSARHNKEQTVINKDGVAGKLDTFAQQMKLVEKQMMGHAGEQISKTNRETKQENGENRNGMGSTSMG